MEVPITQFRRVLPEGKPVNKLSRITPMEIVVPGADLEDDSWKQEMMREWERKWDRRLAPLAKPTPRAAKPAPKASEPARARKARRQA
jgi:hypothetical protein